MAPSSALSRIQGYIVMNRKSGILAAVVMPVLLFQTGCRFIGGSAHRDTPVVLAEAQGICPTHQVDVSGPIACRSSRISNGGTIDFTSPRQEWGVAYAFNCGTRARDFAFVERLPDMDHMGLRGIVRHGKRGSGYTLISKQQMITLLNAVPQTYKFDAGYTEVDVNSPCTWHVKAILGSKQDVTAAIPPIPRMKSPWW